MTEKETEIIVDYYSDILCVWAWIAQARLDELSKQWGTQVMVRHHYVDIFGDCHTKIPKQWGEANGFLKFGEHVRQSAEPFDMASVHSDVWSSTRPSSSAQSHLLLKAVAVTNSEAMVAEMALSIRRAFFCQAADVSDMGLLLELADQQGLDSALLSQSLRDGRAIAALSTDQRQANELGVRGSPTWILNNGRQILYGNVGYRVLNANIEELLKHPSEEASWC